MKINNILKLNKFILLINLILSFTVIFSNCSSDFKENREKIALNISTGYIIHMAFHKPLFGVYLRFLVVT